LRLLFSEEFPRTSFAAEIIIFPRYPFSHGGSRRDIDLATGVLNQYFRLRLAVQRLLSCEYSFHEEVEAPEEEEEKKDE